MKNSNGFLRGSLLMIAVVLALGQVAFAQNDKSDDIKLMVQNKRYVFKAQSVFPAPQRFQQLTADYDLKVYGDTLKSYLPYFGRAYSAPVDPTKGAFDFTSTDFEYTIKDRKKGGWDISLKPNDRQDIQQINLTIFENGTATLQVTSNNRQPISFNGYIAKK
jgi:hypothetical protein